ncbi:sigma-70 family RNA polymerase sigma factor [Diaminobutyricibacter tongyongensis]|uniref:Sigma-70 family RNA polymerase sigma factor n=1 Tax=Leifsonia tongyongensis TaxID=1268043 RepID=A0A6L9Y0I6_9MICO|nr:sigma-70 family RNA polymerase sigma factor [Diaminobutyricibacter tongyongensis]
MEALLRELAPQAVAALTRRYGDFDLCEDAVQEALLSASQTWPAAGIPDSPRGWLITVASRRRIELWRADSARRHREEAVASLDEADAPAPSSIDDSLTLIMLCCNPALTPTSQVALTLRAVGGLTTAEIARAFLVPEATIAQRISRAKQRIRDAGGTFSMPDDAERPSRLTSVRRVLYLIFTEGHTASSGREATRVELAAEAIRLARMLRELVPEDGEVVGLLALMLLTDARRPARSGPDGALIPLAAQDRSLWDKAAIAEGVALISDSLANTSVGPYQVQAAIAAVHDEAPTAADTDWNEILGLYDVLERLEPGPMVTLNRIVALAEVDGPVVALAQLESVADGVGLSGHYRVDVVRAHLLEQAGDRDAAREAFTTAARRTLSTPEQRYLEQQALRLADAR